jgi:catechol 2,3-dioxygenase-like lactoylglutathione lyase family enzyme
MKISGIHHVAIICSDYKKSKHFYVEILGLEIIHETLREIPKLNFFLFLILRKESVILKPVV